MENLTAGINNYKLSYIGKGSEFFGIIIVNWILTIITLGIYYPWAKAKTLKYIYGSTVLADDRFAFHGTGKEMFKGFIKAILIFVVIYGLFFLLFFLDLKIIAFVLFYLGFLAIIPLSIHGSYRYRMSRTSWRGIRFSYKGEKKYLMLHFLKWIFFSMITFGIYGAWMTINMRKYVVGKVRFGDMEFNYKGNGTDYFWLNLKSWFLTIITLGVYLFWWQSDLFAYYIDNLNLSKEDKKINLRSKATGSDFFFLMIVNLFIAILTIGLGYAWIVTRSMKFITDKIELIGDIDLNDVKQAELTDADATGEDITDLLDVNFIV